MDKVRYMISDAADMVHVETHVLRYWEEELELAIPRNEMGHRYYTRENIKEFQKIKDLKDQGYQLKAIRMILHNGSLEPLQAEMTQQVLVSDSLQTSAPQATPVQQGVSQLSPEERMSQFRELMSDIVGRAIAQNNEELSQTIGRDVQEMVLKEMNYLMREQDNAQEERYRKLDAAIRGGLKKNSFFSKDKKKPVN
ncbi:MAG: MerR family transcriptional regulator [Agathobacter sp.]|nr:MerR family transcriptional regulator [Agathobacter sp.]